MSLWVSDMVDMVDSGGPNAPRASHTLSTTSCSRPPRLSHQGAVKAHTGTPGSGDQGVRHLGLWRLPLQRPAWEWDL